MFCKVVLVPELLAMFTITSLDSFPVPSVSSRLKATRSMSLEFQ
jgi:hypothetical protein